MNFFIDCHFTWSHVLPTYLIWSQNRFPTFFNLTRLKEIPYTVERLGGKLSQFSQFFIQSQIFSHELCMALSIGNISLPACYCEKFPANNHFHSKHESFPPQIFFHIWYVYCTAQDAPGMILYITKLSRGKLSWFSQIFPWIMSLSIDSVSLQACYCKSFHKKSFCSLKVSPQKYCHIQYWWTALLYHHYIHPLCNTWLIFKFKLLSYPQYTV